MAVTSWIKSGEENLNFPHRKIDYVITIIEESKDLTQLLVTERVGSLQAQGQRTSRRNEASNKGAFRHSTKINFHSIKVEKIKNDEVVTNKVMQAAPRNAKIKENSLLVVFGKKIGHWEKEGWHKGKP